MGIDLILAPFPLTNMNSMYEMIEPNIYQVNVTWDMPEYYPNYYIVSLNMNSDGSMVWKNVTGVCIVLFYFYSIEHLCMTSINALLLMD